MFGGTFAAKGGIRPTTVEFDEDPVAGRPVRVKPVPVPEATERPSAAKQSIYPRAEAWIASLRSQ
jgi:hypothetical protein